MQSPQKLRQRLDDLMGPPGPDVDGLELTLRSIVALTGPSLLGMLETYTSEMLDQGLEQVALFFLTIRSDGVPVSGQFVQALAALAQPATEATAVDAPTELPAAAPDPQPAPPSAPSDSGSPAPASGAPSTDVTSSGSSPSEPPRPTAPAPPWG